MRKILFIFYLLIIGILYAQNPINNMGNRLQTYPRVTKINPEIQNMVNRISIDSLENYIRWMQQGIRDASSTQALKTQNWLVDRFESYGVDVYVQHFPCYDFRCTGDTLIAGNVIAIQRGTEFPDEYVVISSHYDQPDGPGADDNASGTAGVVEIARILSQYNFKRSILYIPFNAEEYGMVGSLDFVKKIAAEDMNILGCFNLDMLGFFPEGVGALTMHSGSSDISDRLWNYYQTVANIYVKDIKMQRFTKGDSYGGDHQSFNVYEYPGIYIGDIEYFRDYNPCIHKACDTLGAGVNSMELVRGFTRATLAAVAELANGWLAPQRLSAISSGKKIKITWDIAPDSQTYKLYKNNIFLTETSGAEYLDGDVVNGAEYVYHVTAICSGSGEESPSSNRDSIILTPTLTLPYFNDFETTATDFHTYNADWRLTDRKAQSGQKSFTDVDTQEGLLADNKITVAELRHFGIPDTAKNIVLSFWYQGVLGKYWMETVGCLEVTTDRKKWDRLVEFPTNISNWTYVQVPLNKYIGNDFVQIRFRIESSGENTNQRKRQIFIDNLRIDFGSLNPLTPPQNARVSSYSPNEHTAVINWDKTNMYAAGYGIYKNGNKIFVVSNSQSSYIDKTAVSRDDCYQITALYPSGESDFSEEACVQNAGVDEIFPFSDLKIAPNPSKGIIDITTGLKHPYRIIIYNLQGIKVFEKRKFIDGTLDLSNLSKGFYLLNINTLKNSITKKIVIQ